MTKALQKLPIWAYTIILMVATALASVYTGYVYAGVLEAYGLASSAGPILYIAIIGVVGGAIMRLLARVVYSVGDRIFFYTMRAVPDYNLRRLPIAYNDYVRTILFWLIIAKLADALLVGLLMFVLPVAYYLWHFLSALVLLVCIFAAYFTMDRTHVPTWQSGKCFLSLAIPTVVLYVLASML